MIYEGTTTMYNKIIVVVSLKISKNHLLENRENLISFFCHYEHVFAERIF